MSTRIFHLCHRCGQNVHPSTGQPRLCRDCWEVGLHAQYDLARERALTLAEEGVSYREIARRVGANRNTIARWCSRGKAAA